MVFHIDYNNLNDKNRFKNIIDYIKSNKNIYTNDILNILNNLKKNKNVSFCSDNILEEIIYIIIKDCTKNNFNLYYDVAKELYENNPFYDINEIDKQNFILLFKDELLYLELRNTAILYNKDTIKSINELFNLFNNKIYVSNIVKQILGYKYYDDIFNEAADYGNLARKYYVDEVQFYYSLINYLDEYALEYNGLTAFYARKKQMNFDKKQAGIYDIDEIKINYLEERVLLCEQKVFENIKNIENSKIEYLKEIKDEIQKQISVNKIDDTDINSIIDEQNNLLKLIRMYNTNFKIGTNDAFWFCKYTVDKLGVEYISKLDMRMQQIISKLYKEDMIDDLSKIVKINKNFIFFDHTSISWFTKENIDFLGHEFIANRNDYVTQLLFGRLFEKNQLNFIKELYTLNPNFTFAYDRGGLYGWFLTDKAVSELGINYLASCEALQQNTVSLFNMCDELRKLKNIIKIDKNFSFSTKLIPSSSDSLLGNIIKNFSDEQIIKINENTDLLEKLLINGYRIHHYEKIGKFYYSDELLNLDYNLDDEKFIKLVFNIENKEIKKIEKENKVKKLALPWNRKN